MRKKIKSLVWTLVKIAIAVGIFYFIYHKYEKEIAELPAVLRNADYRLIPLILGASITMIMLTAYRWRLLLRAQAIELKFSHVLSITWIGVFFNNFMPGGTGGDLIKLIYAIRGVPEKKGAAFVSIVVDRLIGLAGLFAVFTVMLIFHFRVAFTDSRYSHFVISGVLIMFAFFGVLTIALWRNLPNVIPFGNRMNEISLYQKILGLLECYQGYRGHPGVIVQSFFISVVVHITVVFMVWFISQVFIPGGISLTWLFFIVPLINLLTAIPITPGGLGARELYFIQFLSAKNIAQSVSVAISLMLFVANLITSLPGGLIYILYRQKNETHPGETVGTAAQE